MAAGELAMSEGFFDRWSRRKQQVRTGEVPPAEPTAAPDAAPVPMPQADPSADIHPGLAQEAKEADPPPPLTLADAQALTIDSDFRPFAAKNVAPEVRNAAFRKLFAAPHFNVMDGLDTYVDDYSKPTPLPESVLRQMASASFLNLFEEEPQGTPEGDGSADVAQSDGSQAPVPSPPVADAQAASPETDDHHADLRLQPDDAPRAEDARGGAE